MSATPGHRILWLSLAFLSLLMTASLEANAKHKWPDTFQIVSLDEKKLSRSASAFRGQPLLVQFWASWCRSCSGISSELETIVRAFQKSKPLHFLSISIDETTEEARQTIRQRKSIFLTQHAFHDAEQHLRTTLNIESVPTIFVVDRNGTILLRKEGHLSASEYLEIKNILSGL